MANGILVLMVISVYWVTKNSDGAALDLTNEFDNGGGFAGRLGYDFGAVRLETEIGKHYHSAERFAVGNDAGLGLTSGNATAGKSNLTHYMINAIFDLENFNKNSKIEPFVGIGVGAANTKWSNLTVANSTAAYGGGSDTGIAYQAFAGFRLPVSDNVDFSVKYRWLATNDADMSDRLGGAFKSSYDVHDFGVGLTYRFGAKKSKPAPKPEPVAAPAAPAPKPAPVVEQPKPTPPPPMPEPVKINKGPYKVYFGFDSTDITAESAGIISSAASEAKKSSDITIDVSGHADRSGANAYNDALANKRANAVKNALVAQGISASSISVSSFGETQSEVNTEDGVREDRNRRVHIILK
ncbi:MAG: OmpA family protein [Emcibacteraceae bacterium]|nr:OmpA family protein [Emcibacteraceae bacterium]